MKKKILIANDTIDSPNLGCQLVSRSMRDLLDKYFPKYKKDYLSAFEEFTDKDMSEYSLVIVNGEGSLGPREKNVSNIIKFIESAHNSGAKCALINASLFFAKFDVYSRVAPYFKMCDLVYARENIAHKNFHRCGVNAKLGVDIGMHHCFQETPVARSDFMLVSGGSFFKKKDYQKRPFVSRSNGKITKLFRTITRNYGITRAYVHSWPSRPHNDLDILSDVLGNENIIRVKSDSFESYLKYTRKAKVVFTGRHHGVVMAVGSATPVITYNATLNKTYGDCLRYDIPDSYFNINASSVEWDDRIKQLAVDRIQIMEGMNLRIPEYKKSIDDMFKELVKLAE